MTNVEENSCPFCLISDERIRESNEFAFVIDDAFPVSPGHSLIIPRRHVAGAFDLEADEITAIFDLVRIAKHRLDELLDPSGYNVGVNVGASAGQTVMHAHIHLIPRFDGDVQDPTGGVRHVFPMKGNYLTADKDSEEAAS